MDDERHDQNRESQMPSHDFREQIDREVLIELHRDLEAMHLRLTAIAARLLGKTTTDSGGAGSEHVEPEMDIYENDHEFLIHAALPGVAPNAIRIETTAHTVTLSAESPIAQQSSQGGDAGTTPKRHRRSRYSGQERYHFVYTLHTAISPESARAQFRHGMVEIHLPKARSAPRPVSIPIHLYQEGTPTHAVTSTTQISPPYELPSISPLPVHSHEGDPTSKMGLAYIPSAGEDHTAKALSVGEYNAQRIVRRTDPQQSAPTHQTVPDDPAAMEARAAHDKL